MGMDEPENVTEGDKIHPFGNEEIQVLGMWLDGKRVKIDPNGNMTLRYGADGVMRVSFAEDDDETPGEGPVEIPNEGLARYEGWEERNEDGHFAEGRWIERL